MLLFFGDHDTYDALDEGGFLLDPDEEVGGEIGECDKPRKVLKEYGDRGDVYDIGQLFDVFTELQKTAPDAVATAIEKCGPVKFDTYDEYVKFCKER